MAVEREISSSLDLTKEKAVIEYIELREYLKSEDWTYPVLERIGRRIKALTDIVINHTIKEMQNGRTILKTKINKNAAGG